MKFSLKRKEIPLTIEGVDGVERGFTLRAIGGRERDEFMNKLAEKTTYDESGTARVKDMDNMFPLLLSMSLYNDKNVLVSFEEADNFPAEVQQELFMVAQDLSGLGPKAKGKA